MIFRSSIKNHIWFIAFDFRIHTYVCMYSVRVLWMRKQGSGKLERAGQVIDIFNRASREVTCWATMTKKRDGTMFILLPRCRAAIVEPLYVLYRYPTEQSIKHKQINVTFFCSLITLQLSLIDYFIEHRSIQSSFNHSFFFVFISNYFCLFFYF